MSAPFCAGVFETERERERERREKKDRGKRKGIQLLLIQLPIQNETEQTARVAKDKKCLGKEEEKNRKIYFCARVLLTRDVFSVEDMGKGIFCERC